MLRHLAGLCVLSGAIAGAQQAPPRYLEYRLDGIVTRGGAVEAGLGAVIPMGTYTRLSLDGAAGPSWSHGTVSTAARVDAIGRFLLDPFRETPVAVSLGGGVSVPYVEHGRVRPYLTAVVDVEGRRRKGVTPAVQLGVGGGARVGVVLRTSPVRWR